MNLAAIRANLRMGVGNPSTTDVTNVDLDGHINGAYSEIADKYPFHRVRELGRFSTIASTDKYIVTDVDTIYRVWDRTNKKKLTKVADRHIANTDFLGTEEGKPTHYGHFENYVQLFPIPDDVYELEIFYKKDVLPLSGDTDIPIIPQVWHRGIALLSRYYYYSDQYKDSNKAAQALNEFKTWVQDKPVETQEELMDMEDQGVEIPTLGAGDPRRDFDHSE